MKALYLAGRYLFRGKAKHISFIGVVSCLGIALGVATLIIVISVMNGFDRDLTDRLLKFNYDVVVEGVNQEDLSGLKEKIDTWQNVKSVSYFVQTQVFAKIDELITPLAVKGVDFTDKKEKDFIYKYIKEDRGGSGFFIGDGLRRRFYLSGKLEYYPLKKKLELSEDLIRGYFKVGLYDIDNNYLIADIDKVKSLSSNYFVFLGVRTNDPFKADLIKNKIQSIAPSGVFVTTWIESNRVLFSALQLEKMVMFIILSLIILVASFNIFATLTVKVVEKTKDIGILKALGFTSRKILAIFSLQGLLLGFIGVVFGCLLGIGLCLVLQTYPLIKLPQEIYNLECLPIALNYRDITVIAVLGVILSFVSSLFPAIRASKLSSCEALRYE